MKVQKDIPNSYLSVYTDYVSIHKKSPKHIYIFDTNNNFQELYFYQYLKTSECIENSIFNTLFENTLEALSKSYRYEEFDSHNKLLGFYYIFFEVLTVNKDYILELVKNLSGSEKTFNKLTSFKKNFLKYTSSLGFRTLKVEHRNSNKKHSELNSLDEFVTVFNFWIDDNSLNFEKTAVFIHEFINKDKPVNKTKTSKQSFIELNKLLYK